MSQAQAYIGLGANLGQPQHTLAQALALLAQHSAIQTLSHSRLYRSAPVNAPGPVYVNAVAAIQTTLAPLPLLDLLRQTELAFGRERHFKNAPRTLDLDLLLYEQLSVDTPTLTLPHPRMHLRAFVLKPLAELTGPDLQLTQQPLDSWLAACADQCCEPIEPDR
jgi:2-amino-4-hydroxy-6-hydroxymethyldihydropteridine diphosphokinase